MQLPTLTSGLAWHGVEAGAAGTISGFLGAHTTCLVAADAGVGGAAGQLGVCGRQMVDFLLRALPRGTQPSALTLGPTDAAVLLIGAVTTVVKHVTAQRG